MSKKQKKNLIRIIVAAILMVGLHFVPAEGWLRFALYMVPYFIVGYDIILKAAKGIRNRQPLDECLLMVIATIGAIAIAIVSTGDYVEAVAVMLFYQIGEWFQSFAIDKSRRSISELMDIRPDYANIEVDGELVRVDPEEVEPGSIIVCQPGEKVPIDGIVETGTSTLDTAALTGESVPRSVHQGDEIISGSINMTGVLHIRTTKEFGESTVSTILDLVENASSRKSKSEDFISKFARVYTPIVVALAVALAIVPPIVFNIFPSLATGVFEGSVSWSAWLYRALIFLVISCPCALVISIPLGFFGGIGAASRAGILIKGSNYLEALSKAKTLVCDKTGTLTEGVFRVAKINSDDDKVLYYAAHAESSSPHPISKSIIEAYGEEINRSIITDVEERSGMGVVATVDGREVAAGNHKLIKSIIPDWEETAVDEIGTLVHVAVDKKYIGYIVISDVIKATSFDAIKNLKAAGVNRIVMLTGDRQEVAEDVAAKLGIDEVRSNLLPGEKVSIVESLLNDDVLAFVGDGVNDAPVLARADIGIAMGAMGSDAAIEAADVVLMDDDPKKIVDAIRLSKKCLCIVRENIWFAIGVKVICLLLGALGIANMWMAIFADVGVMVIAVLNALRILL